MHTHSSISHVSPEPVYNREMSDLLSLAKLTIDTFTGHTLPWRTSNRVRSGQAATRQRNICGATGTAKTVCAAQPHAT